MKLWITGGNGFLGKVIQKECKARQIAFASTLKSDVDISSLDQVNRFIEGQSEHPISHILNCAALAHVDMAEKNPAAAFRINAIGPENLGKAAKAAKIRILHFSTEYIFNGCPVGTVFKEDDIPIPTGVYAMTKRQGELRLLNAYSDACIIRTSWLFGGEGKTFLSSLFERIKNEKILQVAADQKGRATYVEDLASAVFFFLDRKGIFHFANQGQVSRYEIAIAMRDLALKYNIPIACEEIRAMNSVAFMQINKRPACCLLDTSKVEQLQGHLIRSWHDAVKELVAHSHDREPLCL